MPLAILQRTCAVWLAIVATSLAADQPKVDFNRDIRPILSDKCFRCHGPDAKQRQAELRLDVAESALAEREGRRPIVPGKPQESELVRRISHADEAERMPPAESGKLLTEAQKSLLQRWIEQGAHYQPHWSFVVPRRSPAPAVKLSTWPRNDIDRFILARLEAEGATPSREADKITLVRRLYFDLTGLPPTPKEVDAFAADPDSSGRAAYEKLVERLLQSPHFGERMAMYWLDLVRYADTVGYHGDQEHPATPYRDWVIKAFNDNMPFDRFTTEQLAGDLLPDAADPIATIDQKIASGYNRLLQTSHEGGVQVKEYINKYDADRVRNLGMAWMGATLGCCECHNHKFDPYTQKDFYSLVAFFADVDDQRTFKGGDTNPTKREPELEVVSPLDRQQIARWESQAAELQKQIDAAAAGNLGGTPDAAAEQLQKQLAELRAQIEKLSAAKRRTMVTEAVAPRTIRVKNRGDWMDESGEVVQPSVPQFLKTFDVTERRATRLDLAKWLTSPDHPQTSRVFVNRLWYLFFGAGLCRSLEDSGAQGEWPAHAELLDWLAVEFVESGWNIKHIVKLLVMSAAYRQSSEVRAELQERDPENKLLFRQSRWRMPAEMIRDQALATSGLLIDRLGGGSAHPYQPAGYYKYLNFPRRDYKADADENQYRRGVYMHWQRTYLHPMLRAFDASTREECTARRPVSNTPQAALTLLNDPTFVEAARGLAVRIVREGGTSPEERIAWAWRTVLSRAPTEREVATLTGYQRQTQDEYAKNPQAAQKLLKVGLSPVPADIDAVELASWSGVTRLLLNLHETITRW